MDYIMLWTWVTVVPAALNLWITSAFDPLNILKYYVIFLPVFKDKQNSTEVQ